MSKLIKILFAWLLFSSAAFAQVGQIPAWPPNKPVLATFQGPGDVFSTNIFAWYSPARAYNAAFAAATNPIADIVDTATGGFACTMKIGANGFADVTTPVCTGNTLSVTTFCTVTHAAGCSITKLYDQSGNGNSATQATLASMPLLILSSTPTGTLPSVGCSASQFLASGSITQAQPLEMSAVYIRTSGTILGGTFGSNASNPLIGANTANSAVVTGGTLLTATATDGSWHSLQGLLNGNGTSSAINVDGADTTGAASTGGFSAAPIRLCRAAAAEMVGNIAEAGMWTTTTTSTDRNAISANQHSVTNGYNF